MDATRARIAATEVLAMPGAATGTIGWLGGGWVVAGWTATEFVDGLEPLVDDVAAVIDIGVELAHDLRPHAPTAAASLRTRVDRWSIADRVAWGELEAGSCGLHWTVEALVDRLSTHVPGRDGSVQPDAVAHGDTLVHGDLATNVFRDADGQAVVLDVSAYLRPVGYGSAIVVIDHLLWLDGDPALVGLVGESALAGALIFRLVADQLGESTHDTTDPTSPDLGVFEAALAAAGL
ncbi:MAG: hypothetical protein AB8G14_14800 [Ilumatobacter sp.]